jgi:ATP-binding cassette subfamily B multidrug efflux pump
LALVPPWLIKRAIDALPTLHQAHRLIPYFLAIVLVVAGQALFRFIWRRSLFGVSRRIEYRLRNDLFRHLQTMDRPFFLSHPIGDVMSRCTNDLVAVQELFAYFGLLVVDSSLTILTCLVLMAVIDPILTMIAMLPMPLLSVSFLYFGRRVRKKSGEVQAALADLTHFVQETLAGIRLIQAYTLERIRRDQYQGTTEHFIDKNIELAGIRGVFYAVLTFLVGLAAVVVLWAGGMRVVEGHLTLGGFVAFNAYLTMLSWPMMSVGFMVNLFQRGMASLDRVERIFAQQPVIADPLQPRPLPQLRGEIAFREVSFRYPGAEPWALREISIRIPAGSCIGLTGPVGCGKTTLLELIPRVFDPTAGVVLLDGRDVRTVSLEELRRRVTLVSQEPFLFSDSIAENIRFQSPDLPGEVVEQIARLVRLDKDEDAFPRGWATLVGERGIMASGGQRQRIALARAVLSRPRILLLDDAFAHLDEETESEVLHNILDALPDSTIVFTSHRVSSLRQAERLIVLEGGRVTAEGPPEALAAMPGYFQRISQHQTLLREMEQLESGKSP